MREGGREGGGKGEGGREGGTYEEVCDKTGTTKTEVATNHMTDIHDKLKPQISTKRANSFYSQPEAVTKPAASITCIHVHVHCALNPSVVSGWLHCFVYSGF